MIFQHRVNDLNIIRDGIEIDLRTKDNNIILTHDINTNGLDLFKNILKLKDKTVIFNVKESQIEDLIIQRAKNIDYYFLDSQIPDIIRLAKTGFNKFILRISPYEDINTKLYNLVKPKYIWVDYDFTDFDFDLYIDFVNNINLNSRKILVHPSLYCKYIKDFDIIISERLSDFDICMKLL